MSEGGSCWSSSAAPASARARVATVAQVSHEGVQTDLLSPRKDSTTRGSQLPRRFQMRQPAPSIARRSGHSALGTPRGGPQCSATRTRPLATFAFIRGLPPPLRIVRNGARTFVQAPGNASEALSVVCQASLGRTFPTGKRCASPPSMPVPYCTCTHGAPCLIVRATPAAVTRRCITSGGAQRVVCRVPLH